MPSDLETYLAEVEERAKRSSDGRPRFIAVPKDVADGHWVHRAIQSQADVPTLGKIVFVLLQSAKDYKLNDTLACVNRLAREGMEKSGG